MASPGGELNLSDGVGQAKVVALLGANTECCHSIFDEV